MLAYLRPSPPTPLVGTAHPGGFPVVLMGLVMIQPEQQFPDAPLSIPEQVELLIARGMEIGNREEAERWLSNVSFHRMRGYWELFENKSTGNGERAFRGGVTFADVIERYDFDQRLRNLLLDACDYIEVSLRTQWVHNVAYVSGVGRFAHLDTTLFTKFHSDNLSKLRQAYAEYSRGKYPYRFEACPIWAAAEVMSFGQLSRWYEDTRRQMRRAIARHYGIDEKILMSLLRHLVRVRNICAHHERLWDRGLQSTFTVPMWLGSDRKASRLFNQPNSRKIYNVMVMVAYLMERINPRSEWRQRLTVLLDEYADLPRSSMGMPSDWRDKLSSACAAAGGS